MLAKTSVLATPLVAQTEGLSIFCQSIFVRADKTSCDKTNGLTYSGEPIVCYRSEASLLFVSFRKFWLTRESACIVVEFGFGNLSNMTRDQEVDAA